MKEPTDGPSRATRCASCPSSLSPSRTRSTLKLSCTVASPAPVCRSHDPCQALCRPFCMLSSGAGAPVVNPRSSRISCLVLRKIRATPCSSALALGNPLPLQESILVAHLFPLPCLHCPCSFRPAQWPCSGELLACLASKYPGHPEGGGVGTAFPGHTNRGWGPLLTPGLTGQS